MAKPDVNGYNSEFKEFVQFATRHANVGDDSAVSSAIIHAGPLAVRRILAVTNSLTDEVHKWLRTGEEFVLNDRTRAFFKAAVADMFGGEPKIPASVRRRC